MSDHAFYYAIVRISTELLGAPINPHLLRDCAASAISSDAPENILAASRILGHSNLTTTLSHYEQSSMLAAGANLMSTIHEIQTIEPIAEKYETNRLPFHHFKDLM
jgi:integrase